MTPEQILRAIGDSPFFSGLEQEERVVLAAEGRVNGHSDGEVLFRPLQAPEALFLVLEGLVEISRQEDPETGLEPVAYLGPGAILGEAKVVTGTSYRSMARFPEGGATLQWPRPLILRRLGSSRHFSMHYLHSLARRLEGTFANLGRRNSRLEGTLDHFDLATILQTIVDSRATGVLEVRDAQGKSFGAVYTAERLVGPISCGALRGEEAMLEILVNRPPQGSFRFLPMPEPRNTDQHFALPPLLLEAARVSDEMRRLRTAVPAHLPLRPLARQLEWKPEAAPELRERIWEAVSARPVGWGELAVQLPYSTGRVAETVREMLTHRELTAEGASAAVANWIAEGL